MDGREADCAGFENRNTSDGIVGSTPTPSAKPIRDKYNIHTGKRYPVAEAVRLYTVKNYSLADLVSEFGLNSNDWSKLLRQAGVQLRPKYGAMTNKNGTVLAMTPEIVERAKKLYVEDGLTLKQIVKVLGFSDQTIYRHLLRAGVQTRPRNNQKKK